MLVFLSISAVGLICLDLGLIASGFIESAPAPAAPAPAIAATRQAASPVILGAALLAGGVAFLILILRRR